MDKRIHALPCTDRTTAILLDVHSRGVDRSQLTKLAAGSVDDPFFSSVRSIPGRSFIHLISLGAGEWYGANSWADYFNEDARVVSFPLASQNGLSKTAMLEGGLKKFHNTFKKHAGVFRNHQNFDQGATPQGRVFAERYFEPMHRGELIIDVATQDWSDDLHKMASGEPLYWSMGTHVPFDWCSGCGHQAPTRAQYCEHLRNHRRGILKTGQQLVAITDRPDFDDISRVSRPADLIAFGLRKVAMGEDPLDDTGMWLPVDFVNRDFNRREADREVLLGKLAAIEKEIAMVPAGSPNDLSDAMSLLPAQEDAVVEKLKGVPLEMLMTGLARRKMMLPPRVLVRIVISSPEKTGLDELPAAAQTVYQDAMSGNREGTLGDGGYAPGCGEPSSADMRRIDECAPLLSLDPEHVEKRVIAKVASCSTQSAGARKSGPAGRFLADHYARYQLSAFAQGAYSPHQMRMALIGNRG